MSSDDKVRRCIVVANPLAIELWSSILCCVSVIRPGLALHGVQERRNLCRRMPADFKGSPVGLLSSPLNITLRVVYPIIVAVAADQPRGCPIFRKHEEIVGRMSAAIFAHPRYCVDRRLPLYTGC